MKAGAGHRLPGCRPDLRHRRCKGRVDKGLDRGRRPKTGGEVQEFRAGAKKALLHFLIECDVSASEAVDGLLRIADEKQLAGDGADSAPICAAWIVGGKQKEDLGLEGISVLELVDEEVGEALLQLMTHAGIIANEVAGLNEEVQKIEPPRFGLENLIVRNRRLQSFVKQRREIRIAWPR